MNFFLIVIGSVLAGIVYGVIHDQFTVRLCLEYFTVGHPTLSWATSPTVLALSWGIIATWWVGIPLGVLLGAAARFGAKPKLTANELLVPVSKLLGFMGLGAIVFGLIGFALAISGKIYLVGEMASRVSQGQQARFLAAGWAHGASYLFGIVGGLILAALTWKRRARLGA